MVVEVEERRFARAIKVGAGADASGRGAARRRGECWSVAALVAEENVNARRWGMTCQAVLLEERGVRTMLLIKGGRWSRHVYDWGTAEPC